MPDLADRFSNTRLVDNLRQYHSELEIQNKALRFSQAEAEGASERFVTLFSHVPLALMVVEETGQILETNGRALDLFRPLESDPPLSFLHPLVSRDGVDRVRLGFLLAKEQGAYELDELEFSGGSNGPFTGDLHIAQIDDPLSDLPRFICAVIDQGPLLAQRHALELSTQALQEGNEQLLQSQTRLAAIINSSLDAILCVDKNHQIIVFNPSAATVFQCATDQALGRPLTDFLPDAAHALSYGDITSHAQLGEMIGITSQGDRVSLEVSLSFEHHADGDVITLFARDLTARKKMEAHRTALESQLRESQKMQAIGTMAGGIAHDFNNIISAILGNVALARLDACVDNAITTSLTEIDKAGRRARDLVRQILTSAATNHRTAHRCTWPTWWMKPFDWSRSPCRHTSRCMPALMKRPRQCLRMPHKLNRHCSICAPTPFTPWPSSQEPCAWSLLMRCAPPTMRLSGAVVCGASMSDSPSVTRAVA